MLKTKVIRRILESCRDQDTRETEARTRPGTRSPAAGGGLAGVAPPSGSPRRTTLRDPRLGAKPRHTASQAQSGLSGRQWSLSASSVPVDSL